jgi:MFS family permease
MSIPFRVYAAHFASHFHIMTLPAVILFAPDYFGVDYLFLGLAISLFNLATLLTQAPVGWLVDRFGGRPVLATGLVLGSASILLLAVAPSPAVLIVGMIGGGLANSTYHPSDYSLLARTVPGERMGRAFSLHTFSGFAGGAVAPFVLFWVATASGPALAFGIAAGVGAATLVILLLPGVVWPARVVADVPTDAPAPRVITGAVLLLTLLFVLLNLSAIPLQNFSTAILAERPGYDGPLAATALGVFMVTNALGVLVGGWLADRTKRHGAVGAVTFGANALVVAAIALVSLAPVLLVVAMAVAGLLSGIIAPSRDMLVREHARPGTEGRVFGFVSVGFSIAGTIGPVVFGWMLDTGHGDTILLVCAATMVATAVLSLALDRRGGATAPTP